MSTTKGYTLDQLRQVTKVARLYHQRGLTQPEIAQRMDLSQAGVSRALREAVRLGIVRTTVHVPEGVFSDLEQELEERYNIKDVVIAEPVGSSDTDLLHALGDAAASYLDNVIPKCEVVGISSWSESILYTVNAMRPVSKGKTRSIVQVLGGIGQSVSNSVATRLTETLARTCGAEPIFLLVPGLCSDEKARRAMEKEQSCRFVFDYFSQISLLVLGIGFLEPSRFLADSGNRMTAAEQDQLRRLGAVGDVCQRFYNQFGQPVKSSIDGRVIGIDFPQMLRVPRRVGIAGGMRKFEAIRASLRGGLLTAIVTDSEVAKRLAKEP